MTTGRSPVARTSQTAARWLLSGIALAAGAFFIFTAWYGAYPALIQRPIMLGAALAAVFLGRLAADDTSRRSSVPWAVCLWLATAASLATCAFLVVNFEVIAESEGYFGQTEVVLATVLIGVLLLATWISFGPALPLIAGVFLLYALFGRELPDLIAHRGLRWSSLATGNYLTTKGMLGLPLGVVTDVVVYFLIFTAFLAATGASQVFIDLAQRLVGGMRGGPAKMAVVGSGLLGTISGSAVANVVGSGTFTIPLMRHAGYRPAFAGAVEAVASSGGQLMPPVMGASVFVMADMLGVGYATIMLAALVPALLYYLNLFLVVDLEAARLGLRGVDRHDLGRGAVLRRAIPLLLPLVALFGLVLMQYSPGYAALLSLGVLLAVSLLRRSDRITPRQIAAAIVDGVVSTAPVAVAVAVAGIVVGVVEVTGLGLNLTTMMTSMSGGSVLPLLAITMVSSIILGMGLPTVACYIILALIIAPIMIRLGVVPMSAHLFVFYFGILSAITPPVALASFAAAGLAGSSPLQTSWESLKLALPALFMPYLFVLQPGLLYQGDLGALAVPLLCASVAIIALSAASVGYFRAPLGPLRRCLFFIGGLLVFAPDHVTDVLGVALIAVVIGYGEVFRRKAVEVA